MEATNRDTKEVCLSNKFRNTWLCNSKFENESELILMKKMGLPLNFTANNRSKKKRKRTVKKNEKSPEESFIDRFKKRTSGLFSKWSIIEKQGIKIDEEMYYSITPEEYARKIAVYCNKQIDYVILIDGFCGVGGNLIQFSIQNKKAFVIGIDLCPRRVNIAKKIAQLYNVEHRCDFICGDYLKVAPCLRVKPDIIFLSPPWGGYSYTKKKIFLLKDLTVDGYKAFEVSKQLTQNIAFYLPKHQSLDDLRKLEQNFSPQLNISNNFGTTLNVFFGNLIDNSNKILYDDDDDKKKIEIL